MRLPSPRLYPFSTACLVLLVFLSLCPFFPDVPLAHVSMADKWMHFIMYGGTCSVIWIEYLRRHRRPDWRRLAQWVLLAPVLLGGLLELMQRYCTFGHRSGEWLDFLANSIGVVLAWTAFSCYCLATRHRNL